MMAGNQKMVIGNQDLTTKTVKENPDLLTAKKKMATGSALTTKMATESALTTKMATESVLTTKMVAGDLGLMMVIRGRTKTAKENPDLLTVTKKRVAGNPSQTTKMVTESALTTKMATGSALTTKMVAGDLSLGPGPTIKMVTGNQDPMMVIRRRTENLPFRVGHLMLPILENF